MKKIILLLICTSTLIFAEAQIKFGVKGGVNLSTFTGPDVDTAKIKFGFNAGLFVELPVTEALSLRPELLYSVQGGKGTKFGFEATSTNNYINIPVLINWVSSSGGFFAETGPQIGFLIGGKIRSSIYNADAKDAYKKNDFSWAFGIGYHFTDNIGINGRYNLGLSNVSKISGQKAHSQVIQIGAFYTFGSISAYN